jgi:hypothetical protein
MAHSAIQIAHCVFVHVLAWRRPAEANLLATNQPALHVDFRNTASLLIGNRLVNNDKNDSFMIKDKS